MRYIDYLKKDNLGKKIKFRNAQDMLCWTVSKLKQAVGGNMGCDCIFL